MMVMMMMMMMMMMMTGQETMRGLEQAERQLGIKRGDLKSAGLSKKKVESIRIDDMDEEEKEALMRTLTAKARKQQSDTGP
jgi:hypothetical protein